MEVLGITIPLWLVLSLAMLVLYTYMMSRHHGTFKKLNIPGPAPWPIIGSLLEMSKIGIHEFHHDCMKKYGKVFGFYGGLSPQTLVIGDKEILRQILVKDFANFPDRIVMKGLNGDLETSVLVLSGDHWKHVRNKITPAFSTGKLRKMFRLMDHASNTLTESLRRKVRDGDGVTEMTEIYGAYAMDVICSTAFGIQVDSQNDPNDEFVANAKKFLNVNFSSPILVIAMFFPHLKFLVRLLGWSFADKDVQAFFRKVTTKLLGERVAGNKEHADFLQLMKNVQQDHDDSDEEEDNDNEKSSIQRPSSLNRKGISFDEILGNAEIFFFAGYETTSITLTMASYYLALYPEYQDKLRQELADKIGSNPITYENICQVEYLEMIFNETLRIHPPAANTDRVCVKETVINGVRIPAGMHVHIPIYCVHHDPDNWKDPEKFIPERFADNYDPMTFLPFGYGPRNCVGMRLAQLEMKISLAKIVSHFRISVCGETQIPPEVEKLGLLKVKSLKLKLEEI
ncbi:cytochrome P450 3A8-like [Ylistrum balloti]|uniref:cytochrome P450 3A8-like n=1 Tax=Ylistrum balloti TaxID=509963 RepID=UPI002905CAB6|nr:cytochrome P450 3A8-like [Ylistrum balloti]